MKDIRKLIRQELLKESNPVVIYSAVCIEDPAEIAKIEEICKKYVPENKDWKRPLDYHMTISQGTFPRTLRKKGDLNQEVILTIIAIGESENAIALETEGYYSRNEIPHITLAFQTQAADSKHILKWTPIDEIQVKGVIRQVAEGNIVLKENITQALVSDKDVQDVKNEGELYYPNLQIINGRFFVNFPKNQGSYSLGAFKNHILDLKLKRIDDLLLSKAIRVRKSQSTISRYLKFRDREIRISDHPNRHFYGLDVRVNWKEKVADMFNKILATIAAANPNKSTLSESTEPAVSTLYHGTSDTKYDSIMTNGLNSPYLTNDYEKAEYYAQETSEELGGDPIIFEVKIPSAANLRVDFPELDEPVTLGNGDMENRIKNAYNIYIKKYPHSYDKNLRTVLVDKHHYWMSLNTTNTVSYEGIIPPENLTIID